MCGKVLRKMDIDLCNCTSTQKRITIILETKT